jgi:hypothetical protein
MARNRLALGAIALTICVPAAAWAGQFQKDPAIDAKGKGLEFKQRQAIDLIGVDLTKTRYVAKIIVRFKGDFERHMRTRKFAAAKAQVRLGPTTITSSGAGRRAKTTIRRGQGVTAAVVRKGRELTFWVGGIDGYELDTVVARSFQGAPARGAADSVKMDVDSTPYKLVSDCDRIRKIADLLADQADKPVGGSGKAAAEARKENSSLGALASSTTTWLDAPPCKDDESG